MLIYIYTYVRLFCFFFFNDTATTEIYTLSLHDALPIWPAPGFRLQRLKDKLGGRCLASSELEMDRLPARILGRSEEHTSELQSRQYLVCRLLLEKKKKKNYEQLRNKLHTDTH